jgi:HlyD family secretion protein
MFSVKVGGSRFLRIAVAVQVVIVIVGVIAYRQMVGRPVTVTPVVRGMAYNAVYAIGTVEAAVRVEVRAKSPGSVGKLLVREGELVHEGDLLAELANPAAVFEQQRGTTELSVAHAQGSQNSPRIAALEAQASSLRVQRQTAESDVTRSQGLFAAGTIPMTERDRAQSRLDQLDRALESNAAEQRALRISLSAEVTRQSLMLSSLKERVNDLQVRAPIDGVVLVRHVERGDLVSLNQPLFVVADTSNLNLQLWVDEADVSRLSQGGGGKQASRAVVSLLAFPGPVFEGRVVEIRPDADRGKKAFLTKVKLDAPPEGLRSGMTAEVNIIVDETEGLLAPAAAESNDSVWVAEKGRAVRRPVITGIRDPFHVQVASGLRAGDLVIVEGQADLSEGTRLDVTFREPEKFQPLPDTSPSARISL